MNYLIFPALLTVGVLAYLLVQAHRDIRQFPLVLADRLSIQQVGWMEALKRKDKELQEITDAYLLYQMKALPVDVDRPLRPSSPSSFKMKPNPPLAAPEKGK